MKPEAKPKWSPLKKNKAGTTTTKRRKLRKLSPILSQVLRKAGFPLGEFVRANREKSNLIGWRQTLTSSPANHIRFLLVRQEFAKWNTGLRRAHINDPARVFRKSRFILFRVNGPNRY